jgi:hypothetical protein
MMNGRTQVHLLSSIIRLSLGTLLIISPWLCGYVHERVPATTAILGDRILARLGMSGLIRPRPWIAPLSALIAAWILLGPWLLGFSGESAAAIPHWTAGILTLGLQAGEAGALRRLVERARDASAGGVRERLPC